MPIIFPSLYNKYIQGKYKGGKYTYKNRRGLKIKGIESQRRGIKRNGIGSQRRGIGRIIKTKRSHNILIKKLLKNKEKI